MTQDQLAPAPLPCITDSLPGIGGEIKSEPSHFIVEEIPLYEAAGHGDHLYIRFTREGWTTRRLVDRLSDIFGLKDVDIGCAGQKDKQARVTQTFSVLMPKMAEDEAARLVQDALPVQGISVRRHANKLKTGHLLGNRFTIVLQNPGPGAEAGARDIAALLHEKGLPNYYGQQRFGMTGDNAERGREALLGRGPRQSWMRRFLLSAYQAHLFNTWLAERIRRGWFDRLLAGDVAKKSDTGGLFAVADVEAEYPRFERREITYTGPIYGARMKWAEGEAGELEHRVMDEAEVTEDMFRKARLDGTRRAARLFVEDLRIEPHDLGLVFTFSLPKGSYATTVLREFTKDEPVLSEE